MKPGSYPDWNFDGSSTGQAEGSNSDVYLYPVAMYMDPFRKNENKIVLCETYKYNKTPCVTNHRRACDEIMERAKQHKPQFGIEQEFVMFRQNRPLGWPNGGEPAPQGPYYCGVGTGKVYPSY